MEWFRGESQYKTGDPDTRVTVEYDEPEDMHFLEILDSTTDDQGEYTMVAFNDKGGIQVDVSVMVFKPIEKVPERKSSLPQVLQRINSRSSSIDEGSSVTKVTSRTEESVTVTGDMVQKEMSYTEESVSKTISDQKSFTEESISVSRAVVEESLSSEAAIIEKSTEMVAPEPKKPINEPEIPDETVDATQAAPAAPKKKDAPKKEAAPVKEAVPEKETSPVKEGAPVIEDAPEPVSVQEGGVIKLTCKITGWRLSLFSVCVCIPWVDPGGSCCLQISAFPPILFSYGSHT